jgi:hypothetical protein
MGFVSGDTPAAQPGQSGAGPLQEKSSDRSDTSTSATLAKARRVRLLDRYMWLWPAAMVVAIALCGAWWGPYGGLVAGIVVAAMIALRVGDELLSPQVRLAVLLASAIALAAATVGRSWGIERLGTNDLPGHSATATPTPTPTETRR